MTSQELSLAISELYARTIETKKLTRSHQRILMEAICASYLGDEERSAIDRLLWSACRGRVKMVDE